MHGKSFQYQISCQLGMFRENSANCQHPKSRSQVFLKTITCQTFRFVSSTWRLMQASSEPLWDFFFLFFTFFWFLHPAYSRVGWAARNQAKCKLPHPSSPSHIPRCTLRICLWKIKCDIKVSQLLLLDLWQRFNHRMSAFLMLAQDKMSGNKAINLQRIWNLLRKRLNDNSSASHSSLAFHVNKDTCARFFIGKWEETGLEEVMKRRGLE